MGYAEALKKSNRQSIMTEKWYRYGVLNCWLEQQVNLIKVKKLGE